MNKGKYFLGKVQDIQYILSLEYITEVIEFTSQKLNKSLNIFIHNNIPVTLLNLYNQDYTGEFAIIFEYMGEYFALPTNEIKHVQELTELNQENIEIYNPKAGHKKTNAIVLIPSIESLLNIQPAELI